MRGTIRFLLENSFFLIFGAIAALIWANTGSESYTYFVDLPLGHFDWIGHLSLNAETSEYERHFTLHFLVNDIGMAFFFAIAGKEVWEATLPGGPLNNPRQAAAPLIATIGGMAGPAGAYVLGAMFLTWSNGPDAALYGLINGEPATAMQAYANGWAIPTATDIAFSYLVARLVFGNGHPAIPFLLLLAIADDALGLIIIAVFYPSGPIELVWMLLPVAAMVLGLGMRRMRIHSFWPYLLILGPMSWIGFHWANLHPALGLLPIIPVMPHAHVDTGLFDWSEIDKNDTLSAFEHWFKNPVEIILGLFGLCNAGVLFTAVGDATWLVLLGLLVGKPVGIVLMGWIAGVAGFKLPEGMNMKDLLVVGFAAGIGFTVAIFVSSVAFPQGDIQDAAKIGALLSFAAAILTFVSARLVGVKKVDGPSGGGHGH